MKTLDENRWLLIRGLFVARDRFQKLHRDYERRVLRHTREFEVDRSNLDLSWRELRSLLDFVPLQQIRDDLLEELKEVAHDLFRSVDSTDPLDSHIAQIYHEVSILKEEHYTLEEDYLEKDVKAYRRRYEEVKNYYPSRLRQIRDLFDKARRRLERILPSMMEGSIVIRSLYLFGDEVVSGAYRDGLAGLYRKGYPDGGAARGYLVACRSFRRAGFFDLAREAIEKARKIATSVKRAPGLTSLKRQIRAETQTLRKASTGSDTKPALSGPVWARRPA